MGMQRLKSAAEAAGFAMAVPPEYLEERDRMHPPLLALAPPPADRPAYLPHKSPHQANRLQIQSEAPTAWFYDLVDIWRGGRATA